MALYISYEDVQDVDAVNGATKFLGSQDKIGNLPTKQNRSSLEEKIVNFDEMAQSLARMDRFKLSCAPNFVPRHGLVLPSYIAVQDAFVLFLKFWKANLNCQTALRVDNSWASQSLIIQGYGQVATLDMIIREDSASHDLKFLAALVGKSAPDFEGSNKS